MTYKAGITMRAVLILLGLLLFTMSAGGALGVVWLRQQISCSADRCITLEKALVATQRHNIDLDGEIARVSSPDYLKGRVNDDFTFPRDQNIVWVQARKTYQAVAAKSDSGAKVDRTVVGI